MPVICRLIALSQSDVSSLRANSDRLPSIVENAKEYSDVYRYWHAIDYLLSKYEGAGVKNFLSLGVECSSAVDEVPAARVLSADEVAAFRARLSKFEPDALTPHYAAQALDAAGIYPNEWVAWEEDFDPLGQTLEHFSFLQFFVKARAEQGEGMLLFFVVSDD